jgi:hypothetical protein
MSAKMEIFAAHIGKGAAGTALIDQFNTNKNGFSLINQCAQTAAAVSSVASITAVTAGFMPFVSMSAHTLAGTTTFLKIIAESNAEESLKNGDILSLVGNVAGAVGSIILLGGITAGSTPLAFAAIVIGGASILSSNAAKTFYENVILPFWEKNFKDHPEATYSDHWIAPDLKLVPLSEIQTYYENNIAMVSWDPVTDVISVGSIPWDQRARAQANHEIGTGPTVGGLPLIPATCPPPPPVPDDKPEPPPGDGDGAGDGGFGGSSVSVVPQGPGSGPTSPSSAPGDGSGAGGGGAPGSGDDTGPTAPSDPLSPSENPDLSIRIEIIHDGDPTPEEPEEPQDDYGCCTGSQDSYS